MLCSERFPIRWEPIAELRFRIVPMLDPIMSKYPRRSPPGNALDSVRGELAEWAARWHLAQGMQHVGAQLAMYWHFEAGAAREFFVPKHIRIRMATPRPVERRHGLPEMDAAARRLQCWFEPLNRDGALLSDADGKRLGAIDSFLVVQAEPARGRQRRGVVMAKPLGYDETPELVFFFEIQALSRIAAESGHALRLDTADGGTLSAVAPAHSLTWRHWVRHRNRNERRFAELDAELYERYRESRLVQVSRRR